jgi:hypothetical protein
MLLQHRPTGEYVVTLGIDFADDKIPSRVIYELFRGEPKECMAFMYRISTPSHDGRSIEHWWLQYGLAFDWEAFVSSVDVR